MSRCTGNATDLWEPFMNRALHCFPTMNIRTACDGYIQYFTYQWRCSLADTK